MAQRAQRARRDGHRQAARAAWSPPQSEPPWVSRSPHDARQRPSGESSQVPLDRRRPMSSRRHQWAPRSGGGGGRPVASAPWRGPSHITMTWLHQGAEPKAPLTHTASRTSPDVDPGGGGLSEDADHRRRPWPVRLRTTRSSPGKQAPRIELRHSSPRSRCLQHAIFDTHARGACGGYICVIRIGSLEGRIGHRRRLRRSAT